MTRRQSVLNVPQFWAPDIWFKMRIIWLRRLLMYHDFGPRGLYNSAVFGRLSPCLIFALNFSGYKSRTFAELLKDFDSQVSGCAFAAPGFK